MEFLKRHYEKVLLGVTLMGAAVGAAFLPIMISNERDALTQKSNEIINRPVKELPPLELKRQEDLLVRAASPARLDLGATNKLFNSMPWKKGADGNPLKAVEGNIGPSAVAITKTTPLATIISLDSISLTEGADPRYVIGVERQAASAVAQRRKKQYYATPNNKTDAFVIREVRGPREAPTELVLELNDTGERITISREKQFERVDGYSADLKYDPEKKQWAARRVGDVIRIGTEDYNIVAINKNEVVLSAKSNNKKTVITQDGGSGAVAR